MNKNYIEGRCVVMSWHNTAKSFGSHVEVNAAVVQGSTVFLPGEASSPFLAWFQSTDESKEAVAVMPLISNEESAACPP